MTKLNSIFWRRILIVGLLLGASPPWALGQEPPEDKAPRLVEVLDRLQRAEAEYILGNYEAAQDLIKDTDDSRLAAPNKIRFFVLSARLEHLFDRPHNVRAWLEKLYASAPGFALDPIKDPPGLISLWDEVKKEQSAAAKKPKSTTLRPPAAASPPATPLPPASPTPPHLKPSFLAKTLPFGIGHFDSGQHAEGAYYLASELLLLFAPSLLARRQDLVGDTALGKDQRRHTRLGSVVGFLGLWGYEMLDLLPAMADVNPDFAATERYYLNLLPFGVGQASNGDYRKAMVFGVVETSLLLLATFHNHRKTRRMALNAFYGMAAAGAIDGFWNYEYLGPSQKSDSAFQLRFVPGLVAGNISLGLDASYRF